MEYIQLSATTAYEFSHSILSPESYAKRATELGYSAIAVTDDTIRCFPSFEKACQKNGIRPIFGLRCSLLSSLGKPYSGYLYIRNETGYHNLLALMENGKSFGTALLSKHHEGLFLLLQADSEVFFHEYFLSSISPDVFAYQKIFGQDFGFGITLRCKEDREEAPVFYEYCDRNSYPVFPFPEVKYLTKKDGLLFHLYQSGMKKERYAESEEDPYFLLSPNTLESLYRKEDIERMETVFSTFSFSFLQKRGSYIHIEGDKEKLRAKAEEGLKRRGKESDEYQKRLDYELSIIESMDFSSYFLLVEDYVSFARRSGIKVGPGRGSAGGSLVSYCLGITDIDPILYDLSFERFLNPKRKTMPDIDIDFEDDRRNEVVRYLENRYGEDKVSTIRTYVTLKPRSALNLIGPALGIQDNRIKKITSLIQDNAKTFEEAIDQSWKGKRLAELLKDPYYRDFVEKAKGLLSLPVNTSFHAPGVILSEEKISKECPREHLDSGTVEFEYHYMEEMGYLKMDILPLSTLTFIKDIESRIQQSGENVPSIEDHLDDEKTFILLNKLHLGSIFQLDATIGMAETIKEVKPKRFSDIPAILALYRPGPKDYIPTYAKRKNKMEPVVYADKRLEDVLKETYGIMVYQEQVMKSLMVLAGFSAGDSDLFRRAISKKNISKMKEYQGEFLKGCKKNGIDEEKAMKIYQDIEKFANYGFNKSHAYSYAFLTYQLLYYKAHYPKAFYASAFHQHAFSSVTGINMMKEIREMGLHFHLPDLAHSDKEDIVFTEEFVYLPFSAISSADKKIIDILIEERDKKAFDSFYNVLLRLQKRLADYDNRSLIPLIDAGVFDFLNKNRTGLKNHLSQYHDFAKMSFEESMLPEIEEEKGNPGLTLLYEKARVGLILSRKISSLGKKAGYETFLVGDTSYLESEHMLTVESETKSYLVVLPESIPAKKGDLLLLPSDTNFYQKRIYPKRFQHYKNS